MERRKPNRFRLLQRALQLSTKAFAALLSLPAKQVRRMLRGRCTASLDLLTGIRRTFRQVNFDWLLLGEGEMFLHPCPAPGSNTVSINYGIVHQHITYLTA